jgi:hypothetical protein
MDIKRQSWKAIKQAEIEKIISLLKTEIGIDEISDSGMDFLLKLNRKGRLKMIKILED